MFSSRRGISFNKTLCFIIFFLGCALNQVQGQLLEDRGKLKTIKRESQGFLFFHKKVKKGKPIRQKSTRREEVNVKFSSPVKYKAKERQAGVRTSTPIRYKAKEGRVGVRTSTPVSYARDRKVSPRYSSRVNENFINRYTAKRFKSQRRPSPLPLSSPFGKKFTLVPIFGGAGKVGKPRNSQPVKDNFFTRRITQQERNKRRPAPLPISGPSYGRGQFILFPNGGRKANANPRNSKRVKENFITRRRTEQLKNKRRLPPTPDATGLFGKSRLTLMSPYVKRRRLSITKRMHDDIGFINNYYKKIKEQHRPLNGFTTLYQGDHKIKTKTGQSDNDMTGRYGKSRLAILHGKRSSDPNVATLYGKSRLSLIPKYVRRRNFSATGSMSYDINRRIAEQFSPTSGFTSTYRGDNKIKVPIIAAIQKRIGQWERSSYKGHHVGWTKLGKRHYYKSKSIDVAQNKGFMKVQMPFVANIYKRVKTWEQTSYRGKTVEFNEYGKKAYLRGMSLTTSSFKGTFKIKKHKGGDPHPSMAYVTGKKFTNQKWKEKWRKLNILWVRMNPGKEVSEGSRVKVKTRYDKDERDIWTY